MRQRNRRLTGADVALDGLALRLDGGSYAATRKPQQTGGAATWQASHWAGIGDAGATWAASENTIAARRLVGLRPVDGGAALALCPAAIPRYYNATGGTFGTSALPPVSTLDPQDRALPISFPEQGKLYVGYGRTLYTLAADATGQPANLSAARTVGARITGGCVHNGRLYIAYGSAFDGTATGTTWTTIGVAAGIIASYAGVFFRASGTSIYWTLDTYPSASSVWARRDMGAPVRCLVAGESGLWIGCDNGLYRLYGRLVPGNAAAAPTVYDLLDVRIASEIFAPPSQPGQATDIAPRHNFGEMAAFGRRLYFSVGRQVESIADTAAATNTARVEPLPRGELRGLGMAGGHVCATIAPDDGSATTLFCNDGAGWFGLHEAADLDRPVDGSGFIFAAPLIISRRRSFDLLTWPQMGRNGQPPQITTITTTAPVSTDPYTFDSIGLPAATVTSATLNIAPARWDAASIRPRRAWLRWALADFASCSPSTAPYPLTLSLAASHDGGATWRMLATTLAGVGAHNGTHGSIGGALPATAATPGNVRLRLIIALTVPASPDLARYTLAQSFRLSAAALETLRDMERTAATWTFDVALTANARRPDGTGTSLQRPAATHAALDALVQSGRVCRFTDLDGRAHSVVVTACTLKKLGAAATLPAEARRGRARVVSLTLVEV